MAYTCLAIFSHVLQRNVLTDRSHPSANFASVQLHAVLVTLSCCLRCNPLLMGLSAKWQQRKGMSSMCARCRCTHASQGGRQSVEADGTGIMHAWSCTSW